MTAPTAPYPILRPRLAGFFRDAAGRYRLELEARLEPVQLRATGHTTTHEPIPAGALELSITGETYHANLDGGRDGRYGDVATAGQNVDDLRAVLKRGAAAPGISREDLRLVLAHWERWHLNGLKPGCAHQGETWTCTRDENEAARETARRIGGDPNSIAPAVCNTPNGWSIVRERYGEHSYPKRGDECYICGRARWDEPSDHCPATGYRYGTAWLYEPLPEPVIGDIRRIFGELRTYDTAGEAMPRTAHHEIA